MGFCKRYLDEDGFHIPFVTNKPIAGTQRYMSANNHDGLELGRRDDMEAILYMVIYLYKGILPWNGLQGDPREKSRQAGISDVCHFPFAFLINPFFR